MKWNPEVGLGDILTVVGFLLTVGSLIFAGYQFRKSTQAQRANFLLTITERFFSDDLRTLYYKLDWGKFKLSEALTKDGGTQDEKTLDELLYTIDVIGRLVRMGVISRKEVDVISSQILRVMSNPEVQQYVENLSVIYAHRFNQEAHSDAQSLYEFPEVTHRN